MEIGGGGSMCKGVFPTIQSMNEATENREKKIHRGLIQPPINNNSTHTITYHKDAESGGKTVDEQRGDCHFIGLVTIE